MAANTRIVPILPATNIERAKKFYRDGFGCTVKQDTPEPGAILDCQGSELYIYQRGPSKADHTLAAFVVDDLESEMRVLRGRGIKFEEYDIPSMGLKTVNGVATMKDMKGAWFKDSEGNTLGLTQFVKTGGTKGYGTHKGAVESR
jgi:predicted enzyme related to lactoylglutathione lyase